MKKLILFAAIIGCANCNGQTTGQNVVRQTVANQHVTATSNIIFGPVQNIGQTSHVLKIQISNIVGINNQLLYDIEASLDGINYFAISPITITPNLNSSPSIQYFETVAYLSFAYIRTNVSPSIGTPGNSFDILASYVGTSTPGANLVDYQGSLNNVVSINSIMTNGSSLNNLVLPGSSLSLSVYGLYLNLSPTNTGVRVVCSPDGVTLHTNFFQAVNSPTLNVGLPMSVRSYATCPPGDGIYYETTDSASGVSRAIIWYRLEQ
jgi:hypothetical protein